MAYISTAEVSAIRTALKAKYGKRFKFGVTKDNHSGVNVTILSGDTDFSDMWIGKTPGDYDYGCVGINKYYLENYGRHSKLFAEIVDIIKTAPATVPGGKAWFDDSDAMTDYFHTAFYINLSIGKWDKKYVKN